MAAKAIREYDGKFLLAHWLLRSPAPSALSAAGPTAAATRQPADSSSGTSAAFVPPATKLVQVRVETPAEPGAGDNAAMQTQLHQQFAQLETHHGWLLTDKLVVKPDQLIKRRGKGGLLLLNANWDAVKQWIIERAGKEITVDGVTGVLKTFIVEPFVPHAANTEHYVCIQSHRDADEILFTHEGGVDIGDVDAKARRLNIPVHQGLPSADTIRTALLDAIADRSKQDVLVDFISRLYSVYVDLHFTYLEINPVVVLDGPTPGRAPQLFYLDLAAKLDQAAEFEAGYKWSVARKGAVTADRTSSLTDGGPPMNFPAPFGRELSKEEAYIQDLDAKTGASLKLTILNRQGRIWTMVAGGGASVVYSDAIAAHGFAHELANYGEYSGAPSATQTYEYAKTILDLMTRGAPHPDGKVLFIGGGIANFTNVASTFKGIVRALKEFQHSLIQHKVCIFVRRAGPNYQEGLRVMRELGDTLGVEIRVFGPETHITAIVPFALLGTPLPSADTAASAQPSTQGSPTLRPSNGTATIGGSDAAAAPAAAAPAAAAPAAAVPPQQNMTYFPQPTQQPQERTWYSPFTQGTRALVYGMQARAVQGMLDFDFICKREVPSVAAIVYPFGGSHMQKFYWGTKETLLPVYTSLAEAVAKHSDVDCVVNFASCRSVAESTHDILQYSEQIKSIAIIAEGVPERRAREILWAAHEKGVLIIGPATVGGIKPGCFKIGNTGGMMDNIVSSKLYRPGSVAYVSKSGGMSNELNNIVSRVTNGVYEGMAIGGDRYPGSTFIDHMLRYESNPECKIMLLLGEVGGVEEYKVVEAVRDGRIKKPVVAWCIGTCAKMFATEVQFGHAGALAHSDMETADAKNAAMRKAGIIVPQTFEELPNVLGQLYNQLVADHVIVPAPEPAAPKVPVDYAWAQELGLVRKPAAFVSTICDERGEELLYAGMRITDVFQEDLGIGGVLSLLWFKRRLPSYACRFIEMVLMLTADHGPAVSGAHNTIVTARAGKDLISSLCTGLLTIGERFGGALDDAAATFSQAYDKGMTAREFVDSMRRQNKLIPGIGHRIKSRNNPDMRVNLLLDFAAQHFPTTPILDFALAVEQITTSKKENLILNVDGCIGTLFVDLLRNSGAFSVDEAEEYIRIGSLNGLFVLGRSIGFIGHFLDQKRLKQGLYRHPWDDISYLLPGSETGRAFVGASAVAKAPAPREGN